MFLAYGTIQHFGKEPPSRLSPAPALTGRVGPHPRSQCQEMQWAPWAMPDPSPCLEELQGQCQWDSVEVQGWGPGWLQAAPKPGDAPAAGRVTAQQGSTSLLGRPHHGVCHVCQLVPGPGSLPGDLVSGNRRSLGAAPATSPSSREVLLSAQHLQLSPAVSLLTIPVQIAWRSALGAMRSQRQRCAGKSRGLFCAQGRMPGLCSWAGRAVGGGKDHGSIPEAGSQGAQLHVWHAPCREAGMQELSLAS